MARPALGKFTANCEYVAWGSNGSMRQDTGCLPGFYSTNSPRDREHMTQKPLNLMQALCRIAPEGGTILDPFAGSATTGAAALIEGRKFIGVEMSEHYAEVAANRRRTVTRGYRDDGEQAALELDGADL
jgi:site-specific DNA-methyltransferase (adenine-specific)